MSIALRAAKLPARALAVAGIAMSGSCSMTPVGARQHTPDPTQVAMKQLKRRQREQWQTLNRQQSQANKVMVDKASLHRFQKEQRDALKRQQKLQKDLLKRH